MEAGKSAVEDMQKEVAKLGLQKHHGIPVGEEQARKARETFVQAGAGDDIVAALDKLLLSDRPGDAVRLAGVVLHALEEGTDESAGLRQVRLIVDAASCSESDVVRSFLMEVAERMGGLVQNTKGSVCEGIDLGCVADELVELVDDGIDGAEDEDEVKRLVVELGNACGLGAAVSTWADKIMRRGP